MPPTSQDPEKGNDQDVNHDHSQSTPNQPLNQPSQADSTFGDGSEPLFSMYTKVAEDDDNKMVKSWQKDADGILIFTGLFSASVAALLAVTIPDLKPNSQDTSAFYLGNIYGVLADPNATRASIPSPIAQPPPFSAPRYAVWVNSLWFLSLVMSVSCALWATSLNQWARRYIRLTQPARSKPELRARMRAFYANGVDKMHTPLAVEGLPALLHLSLFLFFGGLVIYLFNIDRDVFTCVVSWIGFFSVVYGLITLLPSIRQDSPYNTPLSIPLVFLFSNILSAIIAVFLSIVLVLCIAFALIVSCCGFLTSARWFSVLFHDAWKIFSNLPALVKIKLDSLFSWVLRGVMKKAETAHKQPSEIDGRILGWTINALRDDDSLEKLFEAMPGFFNSKLVNDLKKHLPYNQLRKALAGYLGRTLSSKSIEHSVKLHRLDIFMNTINLIGEDSLLILAILNTILLWDLEPQTIEVARTLERWCTSAANDQRTAHYARCIVARVLATVPERDDRWVEFAARISGLPEIDLRDNITHARDNLLLATLISLCRQADHADEWNLLKGFTRLTFDIRATLPKLQNDFCALWNEFVDKARIHGDPNSAHVHILSHVRHLYVILHDAAPAALTATRSYEFLLLLPSAYPLCNIPGHQTHHSDSTAQVPVPSLTEAGDLPDTSAQHTPSGGRTVLQQVKEATIIARPHSRSEPTTLREIAESSHQVPTAISPALPTHTSPYPTHASVPGAASALQGIPPSATLSPSLEGATQQDMVVPLGKSDIGQLLSTSFTPAPVPTLAPVPASTPPVLSESLAFSDVGAASTSNPLLPQPASSNVGFSIPASLSPSRDPLFPNAESLAILSSTTPSRPTDNATLPRLRVRGLINTGSMSFANAVLQLLVRSPRFWNMFKELGDLKGQRGARGPETGGATPLVDATTRLFEEFMFKEESPPTLPPPQQAAGAKTREDEEVKRMLNAVDSFKPIYMYDAMREKRQLNNLLDGPQRDAEEFFRLYLDALDEELLTLLGSISDHKSATVEGREVSQSGQTEEGKRGFTVEPESVESPLMRIFGGKFRSTVRTPNQPDTTTTQDWRLLQLNIQPDSVQTVEDALAYISRPQPMDVGQPSSSGDRQTQIEVLPSVLVLHLKRFLRNTMADGVVKISKPIQLAPELEIPLEIMAPISGKSAEPVHYKLYGVLYHHGETLESGHYTVDVLQSYGDGSGRRAWLHIDDEVVTAVQLEDIFGGHDNEPVGGRCAYMLFYCRAART